MFEGNSHSYLATPNSIFKLRCGMSTCEDVVRFCFAGNFVSESFLNGRLLLNIEYSALYLGRSRR